MGGLFVVLIVGVAELFGEVDCKSDTMFGEVECKCDTMFGDGGPLGGTGGGLGLYTLFVFQVSESKAINTITKTIPMPFFYFVVNILE
jgi:hypothetical protein